MPLLIKPPIGIVQYAAAFDEDYEVPVADQGDSTWPQGSIAKVLVCLPGYSLRHNLSILFSAPRLLPLRRHWAAVEINMVFHTYVLYHSTANYC